MKTLKIVLTSCAMLAMVLVFAGCATCGNSSYAKSDGSSMSVCSKCGEVAGCDRCCKGDAVKCDKCGMHNGSPGCCALAKDAQGHVALCQKCGEVNGCEKCCKSDAVKCSACGMAAGSPGCKIKCGA